MPVIVRTCYGIPNECEMELDLQISGMTITVLAGSFKMFGDNYTVDENIVSTLSACAYDRDIRGILLREKATGELVFLLNEVVYDFIHDPAQFDSSGYDYLETLYEARVPKNTTDLTTVDIRLLKMPLPESNP